MEMLVDSFLSFFGYELDFKTFFWGCQKVVALTSSELLAKVFLFNFESCPFNNISVIFFFFFFFFFSSFVGQVVALTSSELLAKIVLFSFESCPFNNIPVIGIF